MFAHLRQDGANVEVDVARVRDLKAVVNGLLAEMQVVILDFEGFFKVGKCATELFSPSEDASEIVISNGSVSVTFLCETDCLVEELETHLEILLLKEAHGENVANDRSFTCRTHQLSKLTAN